MTIKLIVRFTKKNTKFGWAYRFRHCKSIVATRNIKKHEELWINYDYQDMENAPQLMYIKGKLEAIQKVTIVYKSELVLLIYINLIIIETEARLV